MAEIKLTVAIVSAFVAKSPISQPDLPALVASVHKSLLGLEAPARPDQPPQQPAVSIRRSITPELLTCLDCGKRFRSIRRHLMSGHGLSPERYKARWTLPSDYPMVAPTYSAQRSQMAKDLGLGRMAKKAATARRKGDAPARKAT